MHSLWFVQWDFTRQDHLGNLKRVSGSGPIKVRAYQPPIPFPQRLKQSKLDSQYAKFLNVFKKLEINVPFVEALAKMSHYAKFMKDIISKKRKLDEGGVVSLSANCSAIIQKNLP